MSFIQLIGSDSIIFPVDGGTESDWGAEKQSYEIYIYC